MGKSLHILADFYNCKGDKKFFTKKETVRKKILALVRRAGFKIVASRFHKFGEEQGITGVIIVSESHITIHTWPEKDFLNLDIFFCNYTRNNTQKTRALFKELTKIYKPGRIRKKEVWRD